MSNQLRDDLRIVFGFSNKTADKAMDLWRKDKLSKPQNCAMNWLLSNPFKDANDKQLTSAKAGPYTVLMQLNYELGENNDSSKS